MSDSRDSDIPCPDCGHLLRRPNEDHRDWDCYKCGFEMRGYQSIDVADTERILRTAGFELHPKGFMQMLNGLGIRSNISVK